MNFMSWITIISTIVCLVWLVGLGIFALVKKIILVKQAKKEISKVEKDVNDYADGK